MPQSAVATQAGALCAAGSSGVNPVVEIIKIDVLDASWFCK